jgi:hypothetical protein
MKANRSRCSELSIQSELDIVDSIESMEAEMELSSDKIMRILKGKISKERKRKMYKNFSMAGAAACVMLALVLNWNAVYTFASGLFTRNTVQSENGTVIAQQDLDKITISWPDTMDEYGTYVASKNYSSLEDTANALGIDILQNSMAWDNTYDNKVLLTLPVEDESLGIITSIGTIWDKGYIIGDIQNIEEHNGGLTFNPGERFKDVVRLTISFSIDGLPMTTTEYVHTFQQMRLLETYQSPNGIEAQIFVSGASINAVFYHGGMEYLLSGTVNTEVYEDIIDAFY